MPLPGPAHFGRRTIAASIFAGSLALAFWSVRLGYADLLYREGGLESLRRAAAIGGDDARNYERIARVLEDEGREAERDAALMRAYALNPRNSPVATQLGLLTEVRGDYAAAEKWLLAAAAVDKRYDPRWTLANYYLRRDDTGKFWHWAREAASVGELLDLTPLFRLCGHTGSDADEIRRLALPPHARVLRQYVNYLLARDQARAAYQTAETLIPRAGTDDVATVLSACERLLELRDAARAMGLWNGLCGRKFIPGSPLDPEHSRYVTNGDFHFAPGFRGFDWRMPELTGVTATYIGGQRAVRIVFSGNQPGNCEPLWQYVPLAPGRACRLVAAYSAQDVPPGTGIRWRLYDAVSGAVLGESGHLSSESTGMAEAKFRVPAAARLGRLVLAYVRAPGAAAVEGWVSVRSVTLESGE